METQVSNLHWRQFRGAGRRVQVLLGGKTYKSHGLTYAGGLITCGHCGGLITGEQILKKSTGKQYTYYRCASYNKPGHPRIRLTEQQLDNQILEVFRAFQQTQEIQEWFQKVLFEWSKQQREESQEHTKQLQKELTSLRQQQDRLLNLRLLNEIDAQTFANKGTELRDRIAQLSLNLEAADRDRSEQAELAIGCFELSQTLVNQWFSADPPPLFRHQTQISGIDLFELRSQRRKTHIFLGKTV